MRRSVFVLGAALGLVAGSHGAFARTPEPAKHASASHAPKHHRKARKKQAAIHLATRAKECVDTAVIVQAGSEQERVALTKCSGEVLPNAITQLSVLVRPSTAKRPTGPVETLSANVHAKKRKLVAPGIRRISAGLVERLSKVIRHFAKPGTTPKIQIVSGYRPRSVESSHASARALDFRIEGVKNEAVVAFCKKLDDTGCGFYPNSRFVHIDERDKGAGHVAWIDASRPGEPARYVPDWPIPTEKAAAAVLVSVDEKKERPGLFEEPLDDSGLW
jgi:uncharacterized protein YcbK (DUF882 family)